MVIVIKENVAKLAYHTHREGLDHSKLLLHMLRPPFRNWFLHDTVTPYILGFNTGSNIVLIRIYVYGTVDSAHARPHTLNF